MFTRQASTMEVTIGGIKVVVIPSLKIVILADDDPSMPDERYEELEKWIRKQKYFLQVIGAKK